jgi:hypothetical protein
MPGMGTLTSIMNVDIVIRPSEADPYYGQPGSSCFRSAELYQPNPSALLKT